MKKLDTIHTDDINDPRGKVILEKIYDQEGKRKKTKREAVTGTVVALIFLNFGLFGIIWVILERSLLLCAILLVWNILFTFIPYWILKIIIESLYEKDPILYSEGIVYYTVKFSKVKEHFIYYSDIKSVIVKLDDSTKKMIADSIVKQKINKNPGKWTDKKIKRELEFRKSMVKGDKIFIITNADEVLEWGKGFLVELEQVAEIFRSKNVPVFG